MTMQSTNQQLLGKRLVLGVCGGIAAYKSIYLVRELRKQGSEVRVITTSAATAFVTHLSLQAVSGHAVESEPFAHGSGDGMKHIHLARWADFIVVAPATAHFIARLAHGMADDLLSTVCIASTAPLLLAPAMNKQMWLHAAVQSNIKKIREFGTILCGPDSGEQACGDDGEGRMIEPSELVQDLVRLSNSNNTLSRYKVVITAGPTREMIDAVRYITNRSSGRMGFALAQAAATRGADVHLVAGPVTLPTPAQVTRYDVSSTADMLQAVLPVVADADIFIACAAVSDYGVPQACEHKIKRSSQEMLLRLARTPDILEAVSHVQPRPFLVGFAAETHALESNAKHKLHAKGVDMIVANRVGSHHPYGFDSTDNEVSLYWRDGQMKLGPDTKTHLGQLIIEQITAYYRHLRDDETTHTT